MFRCAVTGATALTLLLGACGGSSAPREQDVWHTSELRPGRIPAETEGERELLARLDDLPSDEPVAFGGQSFVVDEPYASGSGRTCRSVTVRAVEGGDAAAVEVKLACRGDDGWAFVPDVFGDGEPVAEAQP